MSENHSKPVVHSGACLCGAVHYRLQGNGLAQAVCHCRNCQRQSGSAFSVVVVAPAACLDVSGPLASYVDKGATGANVPRYFCSACGSPIYSLTPSGLVGLKAGTLDDPSWVKPTMEVWCDRAWPDIRITDTSVRFPGNPPGV